MTFKAYWDCGSSDCLRVGDANGDTLDVGDVVELISGGPDMTVLDVCTDCGTVDVAWFNGHKLKIASLPAEVLALVTVH